MLWPVNYANQTNIIMSTLHKEVTSSAKLIHLTPSILHYDVSTTTSKLMLHIQHSLHQDTIRNNLRGNQRGNEGKRQTVCKLQKAEEVTFSRF